jgi:glycosyltransferase involved in cell wall biosynthesis
MQQTDFPFVCVVIDDASHDGEQEVIVRYFNDHFVVSETSETDAYRQMVGRHKENPNCHFVVFLLKYNHYSKGEMPLKYSDPWRDQARYVAMCEGDDYWTDANKLQRQVDTLDSNPKAMLVYTNFQTIDAEDKPIIRPFIKDFPKRSHSGDNLPTLLRYGNYVMTLTTMYRNEVWHTDYYRQSPCKMDFSLTLSAALMGDFIWLPEQTGCYRILESGITRTSQRRGENWLHDIYRYYAGLVMNGQCKPLSFGQRIHLTTLILRNALLRKDVQLKIYTLKSNRLSYLLLPVAYVRLKCERLKNRINEIIK